MIERAGADGHGVISRPGINGQLLARLDAGHKDLIESRATGKVHSAAEVIGALFADGPGTADATATREFAVGGQLGVQIDRDRSGANHPALADVQHVGGVGIAAVDEHDPIDRRQVARIRRGVGRDINSVGGGAEHDVGVHRSSLHVDRIRCGARAVERRLDQHWIAAARSEQYVHRGQRDYVAETGAAVDGQAIGGIGERSVLERRAVNRGRVCRPQAVTGKIHGRVVGEQHIGIGDHRQVEDDVAGGPDVQQHGLEARVADHAAVEVQIAIVGVIVTRSDRGKGPALDDQRVATGAVAAARETDASGRNRVTAAEVDGERVVPCQSADGNPGDIRCGELEAQHSAEPELYVAAAVPHDPHRVVACRSVERHGVRATSGRHRGRSRNHAPAGVVVKARRAHVDRRCLQG